MGPFGLRPLFQYLRLGAGMQNLNQKIFTVKIFPLMVGQFKGKSRCKPRANTLPFRLLLKGGHLLEADLAELFPPPLV